MLGDVVAVVGLGIALAVLVALLVRRESVQLGRAARRYRELELEGIEELRSGDPYPEERGGSSWMREPDGSRADADRVLHEELERARLHTRRRSVRSRTEARTRTKGVVECLL